MVGPSVCASAWRLQTGDSDVTRQEHPENESQNRIYQPLSRVGQGGYRATALTERELRSKQGMGSLIFQICHELTPKIINRSSALFACGTLAPGQINAHVLAPLSGTWTGARILGSRHYAGWGTAHGCPGARLEDNDNHIGDVASHSAGVVNGV